MGGGLMQLVAYGAQDVYLTGNPQITLFKTVFRKSTNFSVESIQQDIRGYKNYGERIISPIAHDGDLITDIYIEIDELGTCGDEGRPNAGSAYFDEIELEIGGDIVDTHYGHWIETLAQLQEDNPYGKISSDATTRTGFTKFQKMACMGGVSGTPNIKREKMFIPLKFWFCGNNGQALPLVSLQYHEVAINFSLNTQSATTKKTGTYTFPEFKVWVDFVYLDTDERRRFASNDHEYLIEQLQFQEFGGGTIHELDLNHPVKELIWIGKPPTEDNYSSTHGPTTPITLIGGEYTIELNNQSRFKKRDTKYFTRTQIQEYHDGFGGVNHSNSIGVYSFALNPKEHQPSGTCNFSRINTAKLIHNNPETYGLYLYAINYNILRISKGMANVVYAN